MIILEDGSKKSPHTHYRVEDRQAIDEKENVQKELPRDKQQACGGGEWSGSTGVWNLREAVATIALQDAVDVVGLVTPGNNSDGSNDKKGGGARPVKVVVDKTEDEKQEANDEQEEGEEYGLLVLQQPQVPRLLLLYRGLGEQLGISGGGGGGRVSKQETGNEKKQEGSADFDLGFGFSGFTSVSKPFSSSSPSSPWCSSGFSSYIYQAHTRCGCVWERGEGTIAVKNSNSKNE